MDVNKDLSYSFALSRQCLRILGTWPDPHISLNNFHRNLRFMIVVCILSFYVFLPQIINTIRAWGNVTVMVEQVASANLTLLAFCKLVVTRYHGETLQSLMSSVTTDWATTKSKWERAAMLKIARRGRSLSFKCYVSATCTITFYACFHLLIFFRNIHQPQRRLLYQITYPFSIQKSPNYEITYFIQLAGGIYAVFTNCAVDSFVSILLLHVCAQLINLRMTLNKLVEKLANKSILSSEFKKRLAAIVIRHADLIRYVKTIDNCCSAVLFIHMMAATFQLCFETFQIFTNIVDNNSEISVIKMVALLFYVSLVLTPMYTYCYSAERLLAESTGMAYGVYECQWYDLPSKDAKELMFIVYRSTIPLKLTAGKFATFSLELFGTVRCVREKKIV
ncbi:odorant receptor 22c-like [Odontomachus brunneus]|uniref:odorant receptor 22c-like n=1 Tax=Odontomachus brunneus TaxID=486640 RepID=UPI0013F1973A|nr:odorant receptor 22c-like [Odontomachus brunneus]